VTAGVCVTGFNTCPACNADAVRFLLESGASAAAAKATTRDTPGHLAAALGRLDLLQLLQAFGGRDVVTAANTAGMTPLMMLEAADLLEQWLVACTVIDATGSMVFC